MPSDEQIGGAEAAAKPCIDLAKERPDDGPAIEALLDKAFGLDRREKAVYRLREDLSPIDGLGTVARVDGVLRGSIRYSRVEIGTRATPALLLGPLAVDPAVGGAGVGLSLMQHTLAAAKEQGHNIVVLVGDEPYYARVGFSSLSAGKLLIPGQNEQPRVLALELNSGALNGVEGIVRPRRNEGAS
jgi:predicted N-acetyltransferase YhbS